MITFLLLTALAIVVASFATVMTSLVKKNISDIDYVKCLYYAEAGMAKAIWYLKTATFDGGRGSSWRSPSGLTENFGDGSYKMIVVDGSAPLQVQITVTGYKGISSRSLQASYYTYPPACNYTVFSTQKTHVLSGSNILGSFFMDNDITIESGARISGGYLTITSGHVVSGGGSYALASPPNPPPTFPVLDSSYYNSQLTLAAAQPYNSKTYSWFTFLNNGSIYVNGNIDISGWIIGPGDMVATGNLTVHSGAYLSNNINLIANNNLIAENNTSFGDSSVLYSNTLINLEDQFNNNNNLSLICPKEIDVGNHAYLSGIIYGGKILFYDHTTFLGTIMAGNFGTQNIFNNNFYSYYYYPGYQLPSVPPPGIPFMTLITGSWKETP